MKRRIPGLATAAKTESEKLPDGFYLVRVDRVQYRWEKQKSFYGLQLEVTKPSHLAGKTISARLYVTVKALWKLSWFLHDFGYDPELLDREEVEERSLIGLRGVVKVSHTTWNGRTFQNLEAFAPAEQWNQFSSDSQHSNADQEVA